VADNVAVTPGSGESIAADDVGGAKWQRVKLGVGADGTAADLFSASQLGEGNDGANMVPQGNYVYNSVGGNWTRMRSAVADGLTETGMQAAGQMLYNGATFDRQRGNLEGTLLASAARTTTTSSAAQTNYNHRGVIIYLWATVIGTGTVTITVEGSAGSLGWTHAVGAASGQSTVLCVYPGAVDSDFAAAIGETRSLPLPRVWSSSVVKSDASSWTYALTYALIL
jgi:hypothetical protein